MLDLLDRMLAPLARLLVARGVLFPEFAETMKRHFVAAARRTAEDEGQKITDSRLSVMTGLQRRDIQRLSDMETPEPRPNHLARLVALWQTDPRFSKSGKALPINRTSPEPSFETLARDVRRDVHPRTMLDALLAAGTLRVEGDRVHLQQTSYQPLAGTEDQIAYLASNAGDHLMAAVENVLGREPKHFERALHYDGLTADQIAELEADYRQAEMDTLERLSQKAADMKRQDRGAYRFRAGGYVYSKGGETE